MSAWENSSAAARLRAAAAVEVQAPPPLGVVREVAGKRARRAAMVMAFAIALPVGAMAAAGGVFVMKTQKELPLPLRGEGRGEGAVRVQRNPVAPKPVAAEVPAPIVEAVVVSPVVSKPVARKVVSVSSPLTPALSPPTGEREVTPAIPAVAGSIRTSLADESRALSEALTALRAQHDAPHALELLSAYRTRFPSGALRHEAGLATVEAHRALGHTPEALAALEALPRRPELDVLRAELNAELGRCDAARTILQTVAPAGALRERALFTDATCALSLGARDEAIAKLEQLPESARAKALLEKLK